MKKIEKATIATGTGTAAAGTTVALGGRQFFGLRSRQDQVRQQPGLRFKSRTSVEGNPKTDKKSKYEALKKFGVLP